MAHIYPRLRFQGNEYLLINGRKDRKEGAIATQEEWDNFAPNFAHLMEDGRIMRYGQVIGTVADIEWLN